MTDLDMSVNLCDWCGMSHEGPTVDEPCAWYSTIQSLTEELEEARMAFRLRGIYIGELEDEKRELQSTVDTLRAALDRLVKLRHAERMPDDWTLKQQEQWRGRWNTAWGEASNILKSLAALSTHRG